MIEFFSPLLKSFEHKLKDLPAGVLGHFISIYSESQEFPSVKAAKFAVFGVKENRNRTDQQEEKISFEELRLSLYSLYPGNWDSEIIDLGDIDLGNTFQDSYFAVKTVVSALLSKKIIPIILGASQDVAYAQYRGYDTQVKMINMVNVDRKFDLGDADLPISNTSYIGKIVVDKPYNLFNYSALGYQSYFNAPEEIALMERLYFDAFRLGEIVNDITSVEPIMRNADLVTLDVTAIKSAELSLTNTVDSPNGFDSREICAIARYAGISNRVSSFGLYEIPQSKNGKNAYMLLSQIIWYFIEGVNFRVADEDFEDINNYTSYNVPVDDEVLLFKKSNKTERWWIELPFQSNVNNKLKNKTLLPCTYGEYLSACNQEIPERWFKARRKNEI